MRTFASGSVRTGVLGLGLAVAVGTAGLSSPAPVAEPPAYRLTISDLMTAVIQPRHIKLWLAGQAADWAYAEYETGNLGGAFGRLAEAVPTYRDLATADMLSAFTKPQLAALESAVKAKDQRAFVSAYEGLTLGCNQCHEATGHPTVVIQTPGSSSFPDQVFAPAPK